MKKFIAAIVGVLATIALASCPGGAGPMYVIDLSVEEDGDVKATLLVDQVAVTDATITVQEVAATFDGTQYVVSQGLFSLSSGQDVTVQIQHDKLDRTLEMAAPVETTVTSPTEGLYVTPSNECTMEWAAFSRAQSSRSRPPRSPAPTAPPSLRRI